MAWIDGDKLDRLQEENREQAVRIETLRAVGRVATAAEAEIGRLVENGVLLSDAESMAVAAVVAEEHNRLAEVQRDRLLNEHRDQYAADYRRTQASVVRAELDQQMTEDGTYAQLEAEAAAAERQRIDDELRAAAAARFAGELSEPGVRDAFVRQAQEDFVSSPEADRLRKGVQADLEAGWTEAAKAAGQEQIRTEEATREADFVARRREAYLESNEAKSYRKRIRGEHEKAWAEKTDEQLAAELNDTELKELLKKNGQLARERLERENRAAELLADFEGQGIDTQAFTAGDMVELYLGETVTEPKTKERYDDRGRYVSLDTVQQVGIEYSRLLTLVARGDGKFAVRADSLHEAGDVWVRSAALRTGMVITIGNCISEDGKDRREDRIAQGMFLQYDDDTTTPEIFRGMPVGVVNIKVNGVSARKLEFTRRAGEKNKR